MDTDSESKLLSQVTQIISLTRATDSYSNPRIEWNLESVSLLLEIISFVSSMDLDSQPKPESEFMSLITQTKSVCKSMVLDSQPKPLPELISLIISLTTTNTNDSDSDSDWIRKLESHIIQITSLARSTALNSQWDLRSLISQTISLFNSMDLEPKQHKPLPELISLVTQMIKMKSQLVSLIPETMSLHPEPELVSLIHKIFTFVVKSMNSESQQIMPMDSTSKLETKLFSLIAPLVSREDPKDSDPGIESRIIQIISLVNSVYPSRNKNSVESQLMSLISQAISVFNSMDLDSQPKPLSELISFISLRISGGDSIEVLDSDSDSDFDFDPDSEIMSLVFETISLNPEPELISLIYQILSLVNSISLASNFEELIFLCPQAEVRLEQGKFHVDEEVQWKNKDKWVCFRESWLVVRLSRSRSPHFHCRNCNSEYHREHNKAPDEIKHPLHPKHSLRLVLLQSRPSKEKRECYCCEKRISQVFYYCSACDIAINFDCAKEQPVLYIDRPKWHDHTLALFPTEAAVTCNLCALVDSTSCPFYTCPPCNFVVHESCLRLPRVIKISRHPQHRISFTPSFVQGDWVCGVCRRKINNDYGGYSCIKDECLFAAHSKCATQSNVWDGIDLEGVPEEIEEEEPEPFVTISQGIIQHFSHPHHHLSLDENKGRDYDENKLCQACIMPIYFGNFYSCMQCDFILHEACAKLSCKLYHPIHPHRLTLVVDFDRKKSCLACPWMYTAGFFYECDICEIRFGKDVQYFMLHVQCATISEPLVHESHMDPLFLTSKPGEQRICSVCQESDHKHTETFNCIECDFALCFKCATLPQKVRYKHDKHELTLSYGKETSTMTYWCEVCESKIDPKMEFYMCEEYCCVTLHIDCLIGIDLYMKPGSSWSIQGNEIDVLPNNRHMCRPFCRACERHCPYQTALKFIGSIYCSMRCLHYIMQM